MKNNQYGRSMIEMLGVLTIIAVLTAGGIVGFNKAISAYRWNMALGEWNSLINMVIKYKGQLHLKSDKPIVSLLSIFEATGELPDNMSVKNGTSDYDDHIIDSMGNNIYIYSHYTNYIGIKSYYFGKSTYENCRLFLNVSKQNHTIIDYAEFYTSKPIINFDGDSKCKKDSEAMCLKNLTVSKINEICKSDKIIKTGGIFLIYWY